jgi:hypothetical protein
MASWSAETIARWDRRSRRVLLLSGVLLLAAYLLPRPRIDGDGLLRWMSPFDLDRPWAEGFPLGPRPLVPQTLAFVALGAWLVIAARRQPLSRRGAAVAWASVGFVLAFAALSTQYFSPQEGRGTNLGWPWWDGTLAVSALGLLLVGCAGHRRLGRALCALAGCVGLAPLLLAPEWNLDHLHHWRLLLEEDELWSRLLVLARALTLAASAALLWFGLGPRRARGRRLLASRLWIASLLAAFVTSAGMVTAATYEPDAPAGKAACAWISLLLEVGSQLAPLAGMVVGLFLVIACRRRPEPC